ncbi:MAG: OpgC domain-containing protein [Pseudomonadota bacterium]
MSQTPAKRIRDPRLDFFRGIGMFIIFIAHTPMNPLVRWIPARFGFSDATEIFVFCSGMASAIAFGAVFDRHGWLMGTARVLHRVWQVYWAQIIVFFVIAAMLMAIDQTGAFERNFVDRLNLRPFFDDPGPNLVGLLTLTYVPNYFDILPMYIVILALMPLVMALARINTSYAITACLLTWAAASQPWIAVLDVPIFQGLNLPAEPWSQRSWFFNPFAWQLVFFTGFAFMRGWIPAPPVRRDLIWFCVAIVIISIPLHYFVLLQAFPILAEARSAIAALVTKTYFGLFRYLHFLAVAYLAWVAAGELGRNLPQHGWPGRVVETVKQVGQQSLAVFLASLVIAQLCGVLLSATDMHPLVVIGVNVFGALALVVVARTTAWFKSNPWKRPAPTSVTAEQRIEPAPSSALAAPKA